MDNKKKKRAIITVIVSIIISIIYELVMKFGFENESSYLVDKIIVDSMFLSFFGLHFAIGIPKLYEFIINNRYKISIVLLLVFTLLQYSGTTNQVAFDSNFLKYLQAFIWNLRMLALILVNFEFFMILTNKNKAVSCCGSVIIAFSGACQWLFSEQLIEIIILGELLLVLLDKFLLEKRFKYKILLSFGISISVILYAFTQAFSWMISFGYIFLALGIWIFIKNKNEYKINKKDIILFFVNLLLITVNEYIYYVVFGNGSEKSIIENSESGGGLPYLFSYLYNFLLPYMNIANNYTFGNIISLFPVPMIIAIIYMYKKEKNISFLLPISIVTVLETVFCMSGFPEIVSKLTLFNNVDLQSAVIAVGFANVCILLYMLTNIDEGLATMKSAIRTSLIVMCIIVFIPLPNLISSKGYITLFAAILCMFTFLFLNNKDKRYRKTLFVFLVLFTLVGGIFVNPVIKGGEIIKKIGKGKVIEEIIID